MLSLVEGLEMVIQMNEFQFIDAIKPKTYKQPSLIKGIGDDAAVFRQTSQDIVTAVDTFVEDIHFSTKTTEPEHIGYRALAANISDLAAMGAKPAFYLVSITIPKNSNLSRLQAIFQGMNQLAAEYQMDLIGGDTVSGRELTISITVIGFVDHERVRYRHQAEPGDKVFVTGTLGDSRAGLYILQNDIEVKNREYFIRRHQTPTPRVAFAQALSSLTRVALNDISDGIANEASEIAEASKHPLYIYEDKIPVSQHFNQFSAERQRNWKLFGGEDFELLGTVPEKDWPMVQNAAEQTNVQVTAIGYVGDLKEANDELVYLYENAKLRPLTKLGYDHLK